MSKHIMMNAPTCVVKSALVKSLTPQIGSKLRFKMFWRLVCKIKGHSYPNGLNQILCSRCREYGLDRAFYSIQDEQWKLKY